jgi:hypothetical protein
VEWSLGASHWGKKEGPPSPLMPLQAGALVVSADLFRHSQPKQLVALATKVFATDNLRMARRLLGTVLLEYAQNLLLLFLRGW